MERTGVIYILAFMLAAVCCTGCGDNRTESDNLIIMEQEKEGIQYSMTEASVGDVVLTQRVKCTYLQVEEQDVSFSVSGRRISRILVHAGDDVVKGQLLAELENNQADSRIEELEYQIERNRLLMEQLTEKEAYDISAMQLEFMYRSGETEEDEEALKNSISRLQHSNQYLKEDYQDAIDLDEMELEKLKKETALGRVYADMDGVVSWIKANLEGSTCTRDEVIMRVIDGSEGLFVVEGSEYAELFQEGVLVEMSIGSGIGAGQYQLLPYMMEEWGDELTFVLAGEDEGSVIEIGTMGNISVMIDRRENVLTVPSRAVYTADDKTYVYVVGQGGMREVRWIETGLHGDDSVEIKEGLEQGEKVILK